MKCKIHIAFLLGLVLIFSCNNGNEKGEKENPAPPNKTISQETKSEIETVDTDSITAKLQGEWKEPEYPFRLAHFKDSMVKFTEEGVIEPPAFRAFKIAQNCAYEVDNLKNAKPEDLFFVMPGAKTCEIIKVYNDTLTLSGFNTSTNANYTIFYTKVK